MLANIPCHIIDTKINIAKLLFHSIKMNIWLFETQMQILCDQNVTGRH